MSARRERALFEHAVFEQAVFEQARMSTKRSFRGLDHPAIFRTRVRTGTNLHLVTDRSSSVCTLANPADIRRREPRACH
jgi:hypothetical protein